MHHHRQPGHYRHHRLRRVACGITTLMLAIGTLSTTSTAIADEPRPPQPTLPPSMDLADHTSVRPALAPLLREGSQIQNARGTLREHAVTGTWRFAITPDDDAPADAPRHEFIMLPNTHLGEMQQVIGSMPDRRITFQITGEVFVYDGRNYLLVSFPPRVVNEQAASRREAREHHAEPEPTDEGDRRRSAAEIMRDLERDAGTVGRRTAAVPRDRDRGDRQRAGDMLPENTSVQMRRGRIGRDAGGAWQFIFDTDASGRADPPMTLMPCMLLEQIEQYARRSGSNAPVLISGRVFVHGGRNYLLPTVFQIPFERTELRP